MRRCPRGQTSRSHHQEGSVAETIEATPGGSLDLDAEGKLIGIEIVSAASVIGTPAAELDFAGELVGVKEAAQISGKDKANFLRDLVSREDQREDYRLARRPKATSEDFSPRVIMSNNLTH